MHQILKTKTFMLLWLACVFGAMAVLPYATTLSNIEISSSMLVSGLVQGSIIYGLILWLGLSMAQKLELSVWPKRSWLVPSMVVGIATGFLLFGFDLFVFAEQSSALMQEVTLPELWKRILACFYGAINEEVMVRLFFLTGLAWLLKKLTPFSKCTIMSLSILMASIGFGVGHLPPLFQAMEVPGVLDITRILLLNGIAGLAFGGLYWRYGLVSAMVAHFVADVVVHLVLV